MIPCLLAVSAAKDFAILVGGGVAYYKHFRPAQKFISDIKDYFGGKNLEEVKADAPKPVKELASELAEAIDTFDRSENEAKKLVETALVSFFSHDQHQEMVSPSLCRDLIELLSNCGSKDKLALCFEKLNLEISQALGSWTKVNNLGQSIKKAVKTTALGLVRSAVAHPDEHTLHPLEKSACFKTAPTLL